MGIKNRLIVVCIAVFLAVWQVGCATKGVVISADERAARLSRAEALYEVGRLQEAIQECIELSREDRLTPGLADLQSKILSELAQKRREAALKREKESSRRMAVEFDERKVLPATYGLRKHQNGETGSLTAPETPTEKALDKEVTINLTDADLATFILEVGNDAGVNIMADSSIENTGAVTINAQNVPLSEILDYVSRNLGIAFYVGQNMIWATATQPQADASTPMDTRMYRLRKGMSSTELAGDDASINLINAIDRFVPKPEGADLLFDRKAHVLIVKNTRQNLTKVESLIEALDVCPPQVLIEARFISASISDLSELGIDWLMTSPLKVTRKRGDSHTSINEGASIGYTSFANKATGMNLTYQGLLTEPTFQAVIHALESTGKSRTLSAPKITTVNNRPAQIRIGEDFRYFEEYDIQSIPSAVSDGGASTYQSVLVPVGSPQVEELGIGLEVTPSVGADRSSITLHMIPDISEFVRYEYYQTGAGNGGSVTGGVTNATASMVKLPIFRRSRLETEVIVQSGETVVMGGLISSAETQNKEGVPILSSIPLIGRFFQHDTVEETKHNLLIFVTATILSERGEDMVPFSEGGEDESVTPAAPPGTAPPGQ